MKMTEEQQKWFDNHVREDEIPESTVSWLCSLPKNTHSLVKQFPPSCVVIAKTSLSVPGKNKLGLVVNYSAVARELKVIHCEVDDNNFAGMCRPDDLEIIGYWKGLDSKKVEMILNASKN